MNAIPEGLKRLLDEHGVERTGSRRIPYGTQYDLVCGSEVAKLNVYQTNRVLEGGKSPALRRLVRDWRLAQAGPGGGPGRGARGRRGREGAKPGPSAKPRIGIDEAGKGEYLGPLVVAGARVLGAREDRELREEIGVRDSKELGVLQVRQKAAGIERVLGSDNIRVVALEPREYESRRAAAGNNVNRLLAEIDVQIMHELRADIESVVVDEFGKKARSYIEPHVPEGVELEVRTRAEDDAAVAAASILARACYLEEMDRLSGRVGFELPRGSTHVLEAARLVYRKLGVEGLAEVAKVHFANTQQVLELDEMECHNQKGGP